MKFQQLEGTCSMVEVCNIGSSIQSLTSADIKARFAVTPFERKNRVKAIIHNSNYKLSFWKRITKRLKLIGEYKGNEGQVYIYLIKI